MFRDRFSNFPTEEVIISSLVITMIAVVLVLLGEMTFVNTKIHGTAKVLGVEYSPSKSSVGIGVSPGNSKSGPSTVIMTNVESDKWTVVVDNGEKVVSATVDAKTYYSLNVGDTVDTYTIVGKLTHITYTTTVKKHESTN